MTVDAAMKMHTDNRSQDAQPGSGRAVPHRSRCGLSGDWCLISRTEHPGAFELSTNGLRVRFLDDRRAAGQGAVRPPHLQRAERPPCPQRSQVPGAIARWSCSRLSS